MKTAIFLGAGASKAEGAPMQSEIFKEYFKSVADQPAVKAAPNSPLQIKPELLNFFRAIFNLNPEMGAEALDAINFPTFEEALGMLDLAELRRESLRNYDLETVGPNNNRIRLVRQFMVLAMAQVIADKLEPMVIDEQRGRAKFLHKSLIWKLRDVRLLKDTIFISTNYDILIDNALITIGGEHPGRTLDYGVDFTNFDLTEADDWKNVWERPAKAATKLFKLHGSLNWLYCPACNTLTLTPGAKGVIRLVKDIQTAKCRSCKSVMAAIIVPPTFYKDMSKVFLSLVWNKAESALRGTEHIIFCGYSFPDADIHIKYLIKRAQTNRPIDGSLRFTVINHYKDKTSTQASEERSRYERFLGRVNYTKNSFEDFVADPKLFYKGAG